MADSTSMRAARWAGRTAASDSFGTANEPKPSLAGADTSAQPRNRPRLGTALGGPLTTALGRRATLGGSGLTTVVLGAVAFVLLLARRTNQSA
jgi:hypothetical protein